jgi:hypothetical protein
MQPQPTTVSRRQSASVAHGESGGGAAGAAGGAGAGSAGAAADEHEAHATASRIHARSAKRFIREKIARRRAHVNDGCVTADSH